MEGGLSVGRRNGLMGLIISVQLIVLGFRMLLLGILWRKLISVDVEMDILGISQENNVK